MDRQPSWAPGDSLAEVQATQCCCCYAFGSNNFGQSGAPEDTEVVVPGSAVEGLRNKKVVAVVGGDAHSAFVTGPFPVHPERNSACAQICTILK
jgi:hypothetical protein